MYISLKKTDNNQKKENLSKITQDFFDVNTFRNKLLHSDWSTLTKDRYLVNKIIDNSTEGGLDVELIRITEKDIEDMEEKLYSAIERLTEYAEEVYLT
jgi:hypothetical protein